MSLTTNKRTLFLLGTLNRRSSSLSPVGAPVVVGVLRPVVDAALLLHEEPVGTRVVALVGVVACSTATPPPDVIRPSEPLLLGRSAGSCSGGAAALLCVAWRCPAFSPLPVVTGIAPGEGAGLSCPASSTRATLCVVASSLHPLTVVAGVAPLALLPRLERAGVLALGPDGPRAHHTLPQQASKGGVTGSPRTQWQETTLHSPPQQPPLECSLQ